MDEWCFFCNQTPCVIVQEKRARAACDGCRTPTVCAALGCGFLPNKAHCEPCNEVGMLHCSDPENCGGMRLQADADAQPDRAAAGWAQEGK